MDHLTAVFVVPTTWAVNCADCPADNAARPGMIETLTSEAVGVTNELGCPAEAIEVADHRLSEVVTITPSMVVTDMNRGSELLVLILRRGCFSGNCDDNSDEITCAVNIDHIEGICNGRDVTVTRLFNPT